jgi:hypothetical protein
MPHPHPPDRMTSEGARPARVGCGLAVAAGMVTQPSSSARDDGVLAGDAFPVDGAEGRRHPAGRQQLHSQQQRRAGANGPKRDRPRGKPPGQQQHRKQPQPHRHASAGDRGRQQAAPASQVLVKQQMRVASHNTKVSATPARPASTPGPGCALGSTWPPRPQAGSPPTTGTTAHRAGTTPSRAASAPPGPGEGLLRRHRQRKSGHEPAGNPKHRQGGAVGAGEGVAHDAGDRLVQVVVADDEVGEAGRAAEPGEPGKAQEGDRDHAQEQAQGDEDRQFAALDGLKRRCTSTSRPTRRLRSSSSRCLAT